MRIVEIFNWDGRTELIVHGEELISGMEIRKISTPYGVFEIENCYVKEACFSPGKMQGFLELDCVVDIERCEATILE